VADFEATANLEACGPEGALCIERLLERELASVCIAECERSGSGLRWSKRCETCRHGCTRPTDARPFYELDTSDCESREVRGCVEQPGAIQTQLDADLRAVFSEPGLALLEIKEDSLVVHFENGCATAFHAAAFDRPLAELEGQARELLGHQRFACAMQLSCGMLVGPSTIE
jgi:hypothetical protein